MAPTVLREGSFRLFFFSREEPRMYVHIAHPDGEAKFWLEPLIAVATQIGAIGAAIEGSEAHRSRSSAGDRECLAQALRRLRSRKSPSMVCGSCLARKSCSCRTRSSRGSRAPRSSRFAMFSGQARVTS